MSLATKAKSLGGLLADPKYSDLTIKCGDESFLVHKAIVCSQSPVFAAAVDGEFKEATTNVIQVEEFSAALVKRMVTFLYTSDYEVESNIASEEPAENIPEADDEYSEVEDDPPSSQNLLLLEHVHVNGIADYYDIPELKEVANKKIQQIINTAWSKEGFIEVVVAAFQDTSDTELHSIMTAAAILHIETLMDMEDFPELLCMGSSFIYVMQCSMKLRIDEIARLNAAAARTKSKMERLDAERDLAEKNAKRESARVSRITEHLDDVRDLIERTSCCRNCQADFFCFLEQGGQRSDPLYILRCSKCLCRHKV